MTVLNGAARELIASGALGHLVTINEDGSPQVAIVWVGIDGDELVTAHLDARQRKLHNIRRDPRVVVSFEAAEANAIGMRHCLVVHGTARITEGGAPEQLHRLAQTYVGEGTVFEVLLIFRTVDLLRSIPESEGIGVYESQEVFSRVS